MGWKQAENDGAQRPDERKNTAHFCGFQRCRWIPVDGKLERVKGIEPSYSAWEAAALPLSYTRPRGPWPSAANAGAGHMAGSMPCIKPL